MMTWWLSSFILLTLLTTYSTNAQETINTHSGPVKSTSFEFLDENNDHIKVDGYLGIPYAKKPTGELRFKKPVPVQPKKKTLNLAEFPPACIQFLPPPYPWKTNKGRRGNTGFSEDCLYLNIWVPKTFSSEENAKNIPVMFWIYGGNFTVGANRMSVYSGQRLSGLGEVIVVTINYRMGAFGFLTSDTEDAPGNVGMYDMVEALNWTRRNIASFGGDPSKITLFGQGSGAIAIGLLCVSPLTKGMFRSVILESGSPAYLLAEDDDLNIEKSQKLAKELGCATDEKTISSDPEEVVKCLRGIDAETIAKTLYSFHPKSDGSFLPSYGDEILPTNARKALIAGNFHDVPVLIGSNKDEGSYQLTTTFPEVFGFHGYNDPKINKTYGKSLLRELITNYNFEKSDAVIQYYLGDLEEDQYDTVRRQVYTAIGDYTFLCPTVYFAESYSKNGNNVFYYFYTHRSRTNDWDTWMGVVHFHETYFVFGVPIANPGTFNNQAINLSMRVIKYWSNFARKGSPTQDNSWPKYSREEPVYIKLQYDRFGDPEYKEGPHKDNCDFYREYFGF